MLILRCWLTSAYSQADSGENFIDTISVFYVKGQLTKRLKYHSGGKLNKGNRYWSGRKMLIMLPYFGYFLVCVSMIANVYFFDEVTVKY